MEENPYLEIFKQFQKKTGACTTTSEPSELAKHGLDNVDCPICQNRGYIWYRKDGIDYSRECECMKRRVALRNLSESGLNDMLKRFTFDTYTTPTEEYAKLKKRAMAFTKTDAKGFMIFGRSGGGKTHICTAICGALMMDGWKTKYMLWRTEAARLKGMVNEPEYEREIIRLRNVPVLYIDDFFKGSITDGDKNLAFTLINERYNSTGKKTIISTELNMNQLFSLDEAMGGRIYEMSRGYVIPCPDRNWRRG